uniref:Heat shock factor-binding protein 1 n=1 Tax=Cyprinus carpio carpio TaxID=630221 RepID=A0A9J8DCE8_CYPCA
MQCVCVWSLYPFPNSGPWGWKTEVVPMKKQRDSSILQTSAAGRRLRLDQVQTLLQQMQDKFQTMSDQIIGRIDEMSTRIDDLEKNIADLMTQAGVEEIEGENKAKEGDAS